LLKIRGADSVCHAREAGGAGAGGREESRAKLAAGIGCGGCDGIHPGTLCCEAISRLIRLSPLLAGRDLRV